MELGKRKTGAPCFVENCMNTKPIQGLFQHLDSLHAFGVLANFEPNSVE